MQARSWAPRLISKRRDEQTRCPHSPRGAQLFVSVATDSADKRRHRVGVGVEVKLLDAAILMRGQSKLSNRLHLLLAFHIGIQKTQTGRRHEDEQQQTRDRRRLHRASNGDDLVVAAPAPQPQSVAIIRKLCLLNQLLRADILSKKLRRRNLEAGHVDARAVKGST